MEDEHETSALRTLRKKSSMKLSCCFQGSRRVDVSETSSPATPSPKLRSPWFRSSKGHETQGTSRSFIARMGRHRRHSSDFSYDPLSYSLNFNDEDSPDVDEEFPARNFISRLPLSPPRLRSLELPEPMGKEVVETAAPLRRMASMAEGRVNVDLQLPPPRNVNVEESKQSIEVPVPTMTTVEVTKDVDRQATRAAAVAEVRRSLEDGTPTLGVLPSSREILSQIC